MKKIYALFVAAVLACNIFGMYAAAEEDGGTQWICTRVGDTNTDKSKFYAERTEDYKFSGNAALLVKYPGLPVEGNYLEIKEQLSESLADGTYKLSFYALGRASANVDVSVGNITLTMKDGAWTTSNEVGADGRKWTKYEYEFGYTRQEESFVSFTFCGSTSGLYIDDVVLSDENTENYVEDSGFEDYVGEKIDYDKEKDDPVYTAEELPSNVLATMANDGVVLSWRNPGIYTGVKVYEITDGKYELITDDFAVEPYGLSAYRVKTDTQSHVYEIVFSYADKPDRHYYVTGSASGAWGGLMNDWQYWYYRSGDSNLLCPAKVTVDTNTAHGGKASFRIQSNINRNHPEMNGGVFVNLNQNITMEAGARYKVSFWIKAEDSAGDINCNMSYEKFEDGTDRVANSGGTYDWRYFENTYACSGETRTLQIMVENMAKNVWIDDVSVQRIDAEGNPYGENLVSDGDFESFAESTVGNISKLSAAGEEKAIRLSWRNPPENYNGANIYRKYGDEFEYMGYVSKETAELLMKDLEHGKTYTYRIVPVNEYGVEGESSEISARTVVPDKTIGTPKLYDASGETDSANFAGSYQVITEVKNYTYDEPVEIEQLVAVYSGDEMISLTSTAKKIKKSALGADDYRLTTSFKIDNNGEYTVKVFLIDSRANMNMYAHSAVFN